MLAETLEAQRLQRQQQLMEESERERELVVEAEVRLLPFQPPPKEEGDKNDGMKGLFWIVGDK